MIVEGVQALIRANFPFTHMPYHKSFQIGGYRIRRQALLTFHLRREQGSTELFDPITSQSVLLKEKKTAIHKPDNASRLVGSNVLLVGGKAAATTAR
jgi:hypothetical protein